MTGFFRDGYCRTGPEDRNLHNQDAPLASSSPR